ncbi:hypothetical protein SK128_016479, partial [Halocaridina rubra]
STASPSADESDSGFHGYRSRRYRSPDGRSLDEASESSRAPADRLNTSCDSSIILRPGDRQPLYANAPPKPKRLNSSRDYSTSPERSPERDERDPRTYTDHGGGNGDIDFRIVDGRNILYHPPAAERRTPDAYGVTSGSGRGDYEDVYGDSNGSSSVLQSTQRRPDQRDSFASSRSGGTRLSEEIQLSESMRPDFRGQEDTLPRVSHPNSNHRYRQGLPRPHSADFLEYDRKNNNSEMWSYRRGSGGELSKPSDMRPKSSIGQSDLDHWSEENYAQKMRQSSLYHSHLHNRNSRYSPAGRGESPSGDHHLVHTSHNVAQRVPPAGAATPDLYTPHKPTGTVMPSNATNSLRRCTGSDIRHLQHIDSSSDFHPELSKHDLRQEFRQQTRQNLENQPDSFQDKGKLHNQEDLLHRYEASPNTSLNSVPTPPGSCLNSISPNGSLNNSFMRSASARLPRQRLQDDVLNISLPDDGSDGDNKKMQQREESMKRLLEWKQRMLQSPLTRKTSPRPDASTTPQPRTNSEAYRQQVLNELVTQEAKTKGIHGHGHNQSAHCGMNSSKKTASEPSPGVQRHGYASPKLQAHDTTDPMQWRTNDHPNYSASSDCVPVMPSHSSQTYGYPQGWIPSERPPPQGGSSQPGSDSGGSSKRREGRREASRTRHISGGDTRRATSSSRYNSYSSDEEDLLEERETRKRNRRSSRRSSADLIRDGRRQGFVADGRGPAWIEGHSGLEKRDDVHGDIIKESIIDPYAPQIILPASSPDYVNINIVSESREGKHFGTIRDANGKDVCNERTSSQRAEPVFVGNHDEYDELKKHRGQHSEIGQSYNSSRAYEQNCVYNDRYYATRDPYYVSDVQLPAVHDNFDKDNSNNESFESSVHGNSNTRSSIHNSMQASVTDCDMQYKDTISSHGSDKNMVLRIPVDDSKDFQSYESSVGFPSYDSHTAHKIDSLTSHLSLKGGIQDDATSTGKYSDSGYDTLRAEISLHRDEKKNVRNSSVWNPESLDSSPECSSVIRRRGMDRNGRRPETWSPEKFDRSWTVIDNDAKSKVDESKVVKEYSYEYITPEKNADVSTERNQSNVSSSLKKSSPVLPSLESPKIVQETNQQTQSQMNLVQDRIKKFTGKSQASRENNMKNTDKITVCHSKDGNSKLKTENFEEASNSDFQSKNHREPLKEPLKPISPQVKSSEAFVSPLKAEFATSESTVVTAQEAQVKHVSDYKRRDDMYGSPLSDGSSSSNFKYGSGSEPTSIEYRELRSPQDIMDSRLSRTNIRKFLFDEDTRTYEPEKIDQPSVIVKPPLMKKPIQSKSVKALLKNFEEKSIEHMEKVNMSQDSVRRKFHSDSEMLSNESSSDEEPCGNNNICIGTEKLTVSPASSVLADLRKSADDKREALPLIPPPRPPKKPTLGGEMDVVMTPGYLRLSLAESVQESLRVQEDSDSGEDPSWMDTTINSDQGKHNNSLVGTNNSVVMDLDKPPEEEAPPPPFYPPGGLQGPLPQPNPYAEENYLPMSPPKKLSHGSLSLRPDSSCSSLSSKHLPTPEPVYPDTFVKSEYEEHTYIEMSGDTTSTSASLLAMNTPPAPRLDLSKISNDMFTPESPRYYEIGDKEETQHYEYIYKGQSHYEAIYMEVPNSEKDEKPKIPDKPVDLKSQSTCDRKYPPDPVLNSAMAKVDKSQSNASSDADDEASKDLDSLDPPRNPRFSLSDTFRPASYYLSGAEPSSDPDAQDSSDSDLVPPPPIPLSPPPIDELDTGGPKSKNFDFENLDTPEPPPHLRNALSSSRSLRINHNGGREELTPVICSTGKEKRLYDPVESSINHADRMKRRPVFEETIGSLHDDESFILRSEDRYPASAAYPEDCIMPEPDKNLQKERRKPFPQGTENILLPGDKHEPSARPKSVDRSTSLQNISNLDTLFSASKLENPYVNDGFQHNARPIIGTQQNVSSLLGREYCNIPSTSKLLSQPERERSDSTGSRPKSPDPYAECNEMAACQNVPTPRTSLLRKSSPQINSSNSEPTGSPMIDALRGVHSPVSQLSISHQRTSSEASSRGIVASPTSSILSLGSGNMIPVHMRGASNASVGSETSPRSAPYYYSDVIRDEGTVFTDGIVGTPRVRSYQLNNQRDLEANKRQDIGRKVNQITSASEFEQRRERLAHELKTSVEFLEGKTVTSPDERNVYDSDTLRKMKRRAYTPDPELDAKNVFPYGLSVKSDGAALSAVGHRRTRSLEGLLDDSSRPVNDGNSYPAATVETRQVISKVSQGTNLVIQGVPHIASSAPHIFRRGNGVTTLNPSSSIIPHCSRSPLSNQRTSVSSLQSSGSVPPGATSPYATSPIPLSPVLPYPSGSRDSLVSRESSASRISFHDVRNPHEFHNSSDQKPTDEHQRSYSHNQSVGQEGQDWEDDSQWREQLRRASLRHTRSLETLDENRPRRPGDGVNGESRPPARLSVPSHPSHSPEETNLQRLKQLQLDEYTVDYREGRLGPYHYRGSNMQNSETLERTRRGLTCLEGYEWDEKEEKFRKPNQTVHIRQPVTQSLQHSMQQQSQQSFLADGLPPSPETECEDQRLEQESQTLHLAPGPTSPQPLQQQLFSADGDEDQDKSSGVGGRPQFEDETPENEFPTPSFPAPDDTSDVSIKTLQPVPDVIPSSDFCSLVQDFHVNVFITPWQIIIFDLR